MVLKCVGLDIIVGNKCNIKKNMVLHVLTKINNIDKNKKKY